MGDPRGRFLRSPPRLKLQTEINLLLDPIEVPELALHVRLLCQAPLKAPVWVWVLFGTLSSEISWLVRASPCSEHRRLSGPWHGLYKARTKHDYYSYECYSPTGPSRTFYSSGMTLTALHGTLLCATF